MRLLQDGASEAANLLGPDDPWLLRLWPRICRELGIPLENQGLEGRIKYLRDFAALVLMFIAV